MELSYYETRLLYDTIRNLLSTDEKSDENESHYDNEQLQRNLSASVTKLLLDLSNLFCDDFNAEDLDGENSNSDILEFAAGQLRRSRDEIIRCNKTMLALSEMLQILQSMTVKILGSSDALVGGIETNISSSSANTRSRVIGAEEKIKIHTFEVERETCLGDDNKMAEFQLRKRRLHSQRTAQREEKKKVRKMISANCHCSVP